MTTKSRKPTRIPELTTSQRLYLAGFFDGEGSFIRARIAGRPNFKKWYFQLGNTNEEVMRYLASVLNMKLYERDFDRKTQPNNKHFYFLQSSRISDVYSLAGQLVDYLIVKKQKALEILGEYQP